MTRKKTHAKRSGMVRRPFVRCVLLLCFCFVPLKTPSSPAEQRPKVALVLSGGGARGGAHIGVLRVLEREGVPIDMIVGVSYGALVGGLYAAGYSVDDLQRVILETDWWEITSDNPDRRLSNMNRKPMADRQMLALRLEELKLKLPYGIFAGQKIHQFLNQLTLGATYKARNDFDQLPTPFRAIATDILSGEQVVMANGSLGAAIRASISVPGVFAPLSRERTHLVDGGIVNNLPVDVALDAGADLVIAVDCATPLRTLKEEIQDIIDVIDQAVSFRIEERKIENRKRSHVLIAPKLENFDGGDFNRSYTLIPVGETAAEEQMDAIREALRALGIHVRAGSPRTSRLPDEFDISTWADIPPDVVIDRVRIEGAKRYPESLFTVRLEKFINRPISFQELERECGRLHATGLFQTVDFHVVHQQGQTELVFHVLENPPSELKVGVHYNTDYRVSVLGEIAHQNTLGRISEFYLRGLTGNLNFAELVMIYRSSRWIGLFGDVQAWDQDRLYFRNREREGGYEERRLRSRLGFQTMFHSWGGFQAGYQVAHARIRSAVRSIGNASEFLPGFWFSAGIDTRDDAIAPTGGVYLQTRAEWIHQTFSHKRIQARLACFATPRPRWSVGIWTSGGYVTRPAPIFDFFPLGGAGHFTSAALPVVGLKRDELRASSFASVGVSIWRRVRIWESLPRSGIGIFYQGGLYEMSSNPDQDYTSIHGFGVGGYVKTALLGPIRIDIVSTEKKDIKINAAIGFGF